MTDDQPAPRPPLFTVAIPTCNGQPHIASALRGILSNSVEPPFELLICDDHSDDATLDEVRQLAGDRAKIHQNATRLGLAGNWNHCLELSQTPFVTIFHQDDVMQPGHLAAHARAFAQSERIGLVASASTVIDANDQPVPPNVVASGGLGPVDRVFAPGELAPAMAAGNPLRCSAISLRLSACRLVGGFDAKYRYVLDWDYWLRVSRTWSVAWLADPTVQVRWHPKSETHRFKTGTADLDETTQLMEELFSTDLRNHASLNLLRRTAHHTLARAFLNRALDALHANQPHLARRALFQALRLSPPILATIARAPRLAIQMSTLALAPRLAGRLFKLDATQSMFETQSTSSPPQNPRGKSTPSS